MVVPGLNRAIAAGTRIHFMRDREISEGFSIVSKVVGEKVIFEEELPVDIRIGDELISFER